MAIWLADEPHEMLELFNAAAQKEVIKLFPNYGCVGWLVGWLHTARFRISTMSKQAGFDTESMVAAVGAVLTAGPALVWKLLGLPLPALGTHISGFLSV